MNRTAIPVGVALLIGALAAACAPAASVGAPANAPVSVRDSLGAAMADSAGPGSAASPAADSTLADSSLADSTLALPAAPRDYVAEVRATFTPESRSYAATRVALAVIEPLYGLLAGMLILFSGLSARMRDIAHVFGRRRYVRVLVYLILYTVVGFVITLPIAWYQGFALEHQYGLSNQTFTAWIRDELKGQALNLAAVGLIPLLALAYAAIQKSPRRWWLWLSLGALPVVVAGTLLQPLVFDPAFNKFTPLHDQQLKGKILALAERAGIPGRNVYEVDRSAQTKKLNAYVNGFGASQRIVLWDTTLRAMREDEILFVMGHEMGHYVLGHIWKSIAFTVVLNFALFYLSFVAMRAAVARFGERWGFRELHDVASLPLLILTFGIASFAAQPVTNSYSRSTEHEADVYALEITRANDAGARAYIKLGAQNRSDPEPSGVVKVFLYTHPPLIERIRFAIAYHPWTEGRPNRFYRDGP